MSEQIMSALLTSPFNVPIFQFLGENDFQCKYTLVSVSFLYTSVKNEPSIFLLTNTSKKAIDAFSSTCCVKAILG